MLARVKKQCATAMSNGSKYAASSAYWVALTFREAHSQFSVMEVLEGHCLPDLDPLSKPYQEWSGDKCRSLYSSEGTPLVVHIPNFLAPNALVSIYVVSVMPPFQRVHSLIQSAVNDIIKSFTEINPPTRGKTKISMGKEDSIYKGDSDKLRGELRVVRHWHAIGRKVCNVRVIFWIQALTALTAG